MDDDELLIGGMMIASDDEPTYCAICSRPLGFSSDDQPYWPTGPMCGECYQSRQMDDEIAWTEQSINENA